VGELRLIALLLAAGLAGGCASTTASLTFLEPAQWEEALRARGVDPREVPNPLAFTPEMRLEALRLAGSGENLERLRRLQEALFDAQQFPFTYEVKTTLTAVEAFYRRQGNCLSFTNLFVALGRSLGIPVQSGLITRIRSSEREDDLIVVNTHVVALLSHAGGMTYFDFDRTRRRQPAVVRPLNDLWVTALYLNNRGADELRLRHPEAAERLFANAVKLAPEFAPAWGNLGVARRRLGDIGGALAAYAEALRSDPTNPTVLSNLALLYTSLGRTVEADAALAAARLSGASPHLLIVRGDVELARGKVAEARRFYLRARRLEPRLADAWVALARAELAAGRPAQARRLATKALRLDPQVAGGAALLDTIEGKR
jgi:tetratricopeptide (TPR) repeat protein